MIWFCMRVIDGIMFITSAKRSISFKFNGSVAETSTASKDDSALLNPLWMLMGDFNRILDFDEKLGGVKFDQLSF